MISKFKVEEILNPSTNKRKKNFWLEIPFELPSPYVKSYGPFCPHFSCPLSYQIEFINHRQGARSSDAHFQLKCLEHLNTFFSVHRRVCHCRKSHKCTAPSRDVMHFPDRHGSTSESDESIHHMFGRASVAVCP